MNIANFIGTTINIHQIIECFLHLLYHWNFSVFFALDHSPDSRMILILQTIPILFHRFQWRIVDVFPLLENWYQVAPIFHEVFLRSLRIARFRREEFPRDQIELFVSFSKKFYHVAPIARTSQSQFSTLEKTKHGRHPTLNYLLKRSFPWIAHGNDDRKLRINLCLYHVAPISPLFASNWTPRILTSVISLLRAYWSRGRYVRRRPGNKIHHRSRFCCDSFSSWILLRSLRHCIRAHCRTEMSDIEKAQQMIPLITCEISFG